MNALNKLDLNSDLLKAEEILKNNGCTEMYLFGSVIEGKAGEHSDIDIAVKGIPKNKFFCIYGKILSQLKHPVDLICLDYSNEFTDFLINSGGLKRVF